MASEDLEGFIGKTGQASRLRIEKDYGGGFVRLRASEAERRQAVQDIRCCEDAVIELLRNARDAHAAHIFVATEKEGSQRTIVVIDDGCGIPEEMHELVFEPRVTSKLDTSHMDRWGIHGRGMALYSVAQNAVRAAVESSAPGMGTSIGVAFDLAKLGEKSDQSTFPRFLRSEDSTVAVRGPKNICRNVCEFAIDAHADCSVYLGSPSEIAATLYAYGESTLSQVERLFCKSERETPLIKRMALASDPADFARIAESLGLLLSERTARRIIDGSIAPLEPILNRVRIEDPAGPSGKPKRRAKATAGALAPVRLGQNERRALCDAAERAFAPIAERYYLEPDVQARVRVSPDSIVISIPLAAATGEEGNADV